MTTFYYDFGQAVNGTGTLASPFNGSVWPGAALVAGDFHKFKRNTSKTMAFTIGTAGTLANPLHFGAWFNADGTDDPAQTVPVITCTTQITQFATSKDYIYLDSISFHVSGIADASDKSLFFAGTGCHITNCFFRCTSGCVGVWDKDDVIIDSCNMQGVTHGATFNNQLIAVSCSSTRNNIQITNNVLGHGGGGGTTSHNVIAICTDATKQLTNVVITNNLIRTATLTPNPNTAAYAVRLSQVQAPFVTNNTLWYHQVGLFVTGGGAVVTSALITGNNCRFNYHFGIQITTNTSSFTISNNVCSDNGTSTNDGTILLAFGRGIELSSAAGQGSCTTHTLTLNTCQRNLNYGGPNDNASEGVGIGLDDGAVNCTVTRNNCSDNEGNGVQIFGGGSAVTWTDTHNTVVANFFKNNCVNAIVNRRSGGTHKSGNFNADIGCSWLYGSTSLIANNTFGGTTAVGISSDSHCTSAVYANNIFLSIAHPIVNGNTPGATDYQNNIYVSATQRYSSTGTDVNGEATFPLLSYTGTLDKTTDPSLDVNYRIQSSGSSAFHAGANVIGSFVDYGGTAFNSGQPSIGMYEFVGAPGQQGGHERRALFHSR